MGDPPAIVLRKKYWGVFKHFPTLGVDDMASLQSPSMELDP